jgi:hypothetical protein
MNGDGVLLAALGWRELQLYDERHMGMHGGQGPDEDRVEAAADDIDFAVGMGDGVIR